MIHLRSVTNWDARPVVPPSSTCVLWLLFALLSSENDECGMDRAPSELSSSLLSILSDPAKFRGAIYS